MPSPADARSYGSVFDEVAEDYDRHRPSYPDVLVDRACELAGIDGGGPVLEIGCGTGQLTRSLLARELRLLHGDGLADPLGDGHRTPAQTAGLRST